MENDATPELRADCIPKPSEVSSVVVVRRRTCFDLDRNNASVAVLHDEIDLVFAVRVAEVEKLRAFGESFLALVDATPAPFWDGVKNVRVNEDQHTRWKAALTPAKETDNG